MYLTNHGLFSEINQTTFERHWPWPWPWTATLTLVFVYLRWKGIICSCALLLCVYTIYILSLLHFFNFCLFELSHIPFNYCKFFSTGTNNLSIVIALKNLNSVNYLTPYDFFILSWMNCAWNPVWSHSRSVSLRQLSMMSQFFWMNSKTSSPLPRWKYRRRSFPTDASDSWKFQKSAKTRIRGEHDIFKDVFESCRLINTWLRSDWSYNAPGVSFRLTFSPAGRRSRQRRLSPTCRRSQVIYTFCGFVGSHRLAKQTLPISARKVIYSLISNANHAPANKPTYSTNRLSRFTKF